MKILIYTTFLILSHFMAPVSCLSADNTPTPISISIDYRTPIEPIKIKKWFPKHTHKQKNHKPTNNDNISIYLIPALLLLPLVGLPLGVGLALLWLWITSAALLFTLFLFLLILLLSLNFDTQQNKVGLIITTVAKSFLWLIFAVYSGLLLIDVIITGLIAGLLWLWLTPLILLVLAVFLTIFLAT